MKIIHFSSKIYFYFCSIVQHRWMIDKISLFITQSLGCMGLILEKLLLDKSVATYYEKMDFNKTNI